MSISIDGPAGAGKSTIAKRVARELGYIYVDTGALYRTVALYIINNNIDYNDYDKVKKSLDNIDISIQYENDIQNIYLNNKNVTSKIRSEKVSIVASKTSSYRCVREKLFSLQKDLARKFEVVMDGRDIGTVILPDAKLKIYLTASPLVRGKRRYDELILKNEKADLDKIIKEIEERDKRDKNREISPLKKAKDAILIDSSDMTIDEVVNKITSLTKNSSK